MVKKLTAALLACSLLLALTACGTGGMVLRNPASPAASAPEDPVTRSFTDSLGRTVSLPAEVDRVALSGPMAQIVLFALCPDRLVGLSSAWTEDAEAYLDPAYFNMPEIGQLYGGKGALNLETLLASGAQVVVDVGEPKGKMAEELDALQEQSGVPFVHVTATIDTMDGAYRMLGELLGMEAEAEELAAYCASVYARIVDILGQVGRKKVLYIAGEAGLNVIAKGSFHAEIIDFMADNLAAVDEPSSLGTGNEVDMEQLLNWNPDVILFAPDSVYETVGADPAWQTITAVQNGAYYEVPMGPYNWMGFPPSVQRLLGMLWAAKVLYPEAAEYDLYKEAARYFELFYHCELTREQYGKFVAHSLPE
ncbi:MAG: ABC transporter substrate-binding protein [Oscillibacter sp.]|nr:ABC transporter substrate-binding protein [Oscillibacter sp.]